MRRSFIVAVSILLTFCSFAQSKKDIKKNKIASVTVTETANGKTIDDSKTMYDANGEVIEKSEYNKEGSLKKTMKYKFNNLGDAVEEYEYDEKHNLKEQTLIRYNANGGKKEKLVYDGDTKLLNKDEYY